MDILIVSEQNPRHYFDNRRQTTAKKEFHALNICPCISARTYNVACGIALITGQAVRLNVSSGGQFDAENKAKSGYFRS